MTKPLSETHPTLWKYVRDENGDFACYEDTIDKIQSCTVDVAEHERIVAEAMSVGENHGILMERIRVREAIEDCITVHQLKIKLGLFGDEVKEE